MSRIGKQPIKLQSEIKVSIDGNTVSIKGPKGELAQAMAGGITAAVEQDELLVRRMDDSKRQRALHGLMRSLLANAVDGVSKGFTRRLEIHGVGYAGEVKGKVIDFKLGFSHPVRFQIPEGIAVTLERNALTVSGCDRQQVGQVAADIRSLRPPDVYKQKGIRYADEILRKKAGKAGAK